MRGPETTFSWPSRHRSSWALAGFIFLSLILHSAPFFLFQTAAPKLTEPPRKAYPVQLLTPFDADGTRSQENEEVLRWVNANDPAIITRIPVVEPNGLLDIAYEPSFATPRTPPLDVPPEPSTVQFPPARDPLAFIRSANPVPTAIPMKRARQATSLSFSSALARRAPAAAAFSPAVKSKVPVQNVQVMLGVVPEGEVRYTFMQSSSGVPALDQEAINFLSTLVFAPTSALDWGTVTVNWGDDIAQ